MKRQKERPSGMSFSKSPLGKREKGSFSSALGITLSTDAEPYRPSKSGNISPTLSKRENNSPTTVKRENSPMYSSAPPSGSSSRRTTLSTTTLCNNGYPNNNSNINTSLYKTELCRSFVETGTCRYGNKCQFAHGEKELRQVQRHPKYKTEICQSYQLTGTCKYGSRCRFIHVLTDNINSSQSSSSSLSSSFDNVIQNNHSPFTQHLKDDNDTERLPIFQQLAH